MAEVIYNLENWDLVDEYAQIESFEELAKKIEVNENDFNHCLLEDAIDEWAKDVEKATWKFRNTLSRRKRWLLDEMHDRGMIEEIK